VELVISPKLLLHITYSYRYFAALLLRDAWHSSSIAGRSAPLKILCELGRSSCSEYEAYHSRGCNNSIRSRGTLASFPAAGLSAECVVQH